MDVPLDSGAEILNSGFKKSFKSFVDVVKCKPSDNLQEMNLAGFSNISSMCRNSSAIDLKNSESIVNFPVLRKDDKPAIFLTEEEVLDLSRPFRLTLIGKFTAGRPKWHVVQSVFKELKLKGDFRCLNLDVRHIVIYLNDFDDYARLFVKQRMFFHGFLLKILKWTPEFSIDVEPSIVPIWIHLPMLKLHLFNQALLFSIAAIYGTPLKLDFATSYCLRPGCARVLVELDLRKKYEQELWIGSEKTGYMQQVEFQNLPGYCFHCGKIGHTDSICFHLHPELNSIRNNKRNKELRRSVNAAIGSSLAQNDSVKSVEIIESTIVQLVNNDLSLDNVLNSDDTGLQISTDFQKSTGFQNSLQPGNINQAVVVDDNIEVQNSIFQQDSNQIQGSEGNGVYDFVDDDCLLNNNERDQSVVVGEVAINVFSSPMLLDNVAEAFDIRVDQNLQQQKDSEQFLLSVAAEEPVLRFHPNIGNNLNGNSAVEVLVGKNQNPQKDMGQLLVDLDDENCPVFVSNQKTKERHLWADEVEEQTILNNITLGEQISEAEDVHQINKVKDTLLSNKLNYDLGPNFQDFSKTFYLKDSSTKSLGDKADSEGEESFYQLLQDKGKNFGKENFYRSPIITRSRTKGAQQDINSSIEENKPDGYVSDSWAYKELLLKL